MNQVVDEPLTSTVRPAQLSVLTVRVIKSFPYRTVKYHIFQNIDITTVTAGELLEKLQNLIKTESAFRAYRNVSLDTIKIYTKAHGSKSMNLIINFEDDDTWILNDPSKTLQDYGIQNETELSVFNREAYEEYKKNPEEKW